MDHSFNNVSVDFSGALVGRNGDVIVVNVTTRHINLDMIGTQDNRATFTANIWATGTIKDGIFW